MSEAQPPSAQKNRTFENDECIEKVSTLYLDTETADVNFSFGLMDDDTNVQIAAHKSLLAATSNVFKAMFYGAMKETGNRIHLPDTSEAAFMEFLQYFYKSNVDLSSANVEEVLYLGQKYNVKQCVIDCGRFLTKLVDSGNVCSRLRLAIQYDRRELVEVCKKCILVNTAAVFESAGFLTSDRQVVEHILEMDLSCKEAEIFEAMMAWVKVSSKQNVLTKELVETYLGDLFYEIRFATMKIEEFCALANREEYDAVLSSHHKTITNMIVLPHLLAEGSHRFKTEPRAIGRYLGAAIECYCTSNREWKQFNLVSIHETKFSVNKPLFLKNIVCFQVFRKVYWDSDLEVDVKIFECRNVKCTNGNLLLETKAVLKSNFKGIFLPQLVIVRPGLFYVIRIGPFLRPHHCNSYKLLRRVNMRCGIVVDFYDSNADEDTDEDDSGSYFHAIFGNFY